MKKIILAMAFAVVALMSVGCKPIVTKDCIYTVKEGSFYFEDDLFKVIKVRDAVVSKAFDGQSQKILTGDPEQCKTEAIKWFNTGMAKVTDEEILDLLSNGEYFEIIFTDGYKEGTEEVNILASRMWSKK
ncbi:MAG: hypothetical protein HUJ95_02315 [Bacteroidales bacterium]|nr:hypothetical protein [Bacteroidales bacterium]